MKIKTFLLINLLFSGVSFSQVGINTDNPKATLDIVASPENTLLVDGLIAPRLTGDELKSKDNLYDLDQTGTIVYVSTALANSETSIKTENVTSSGYYYFDGTIWQKISGADTKTQPWYKQGTTQEATENTDKIYQMGSVAIGRNTAQTGDIALDVLGSLSVGDNNNPSTNSATFGYSNSVTNSPASFLAGLYNWTEEGENNTLLGFYNTAHHVEMGVSIGFGNSLFDGYNPMAFGRGNNVSNQVAMAIGTNNYAAEEQTLAMGNNSIARGLKSITLASDYAIAGSRDEIVMGAYNAITIGNPKERVPTDPIFQLGNGYTIIGSHDNYFTNAITVLKNGKIGFGILGREDAAKPTELLDLGGNATTGEGGLKIRNINSPAYTGNVTTDKIVVADADGVLKTVDAQSFNLTSSLNTLPVYSNDADADADITLRSGSLYKTVAGGRTVFQKP